MLFKIVPFVSDWLFFSGGVTRKTNVLRLSAPSSCAPLASILSVFLVSSVIQLTENRLSPLLFFALFSSLL